MTSATRSPRHASRMGDEPPFIVLSWNGTAASMRGTARCVLGGEAGAEGRVPAGTFAAWSWDGRTLEAWTDRLGFQPLYYAVSGSTLWLSPSIPRLVAEGAPTELDWAALAVFLRIRVFLADDTPFLHVRAVPPAARIRWTEGRAHVEGARSQGPRLEISRTAAIDRYVELFRQAVLAPSGADVPVVVPLSGGRDSRHILAELRAAGRPLECVTIYPAPGNSTEDATIAEEVAAQLQIPHVVVGPTKNRYADERDKNWMTSLGVIRDHFWVMELMRHLDGRGPLVFDGIAGDTLSEPKYMNARRLELFRQRELRRYADEDLLTEGYLPVVLRPEVYRLVSREVALERFVRELETHADTPNPVSSFRFWNRTRRSVGLAPFGMIARVATVRAPFLDPDLYDFLSSLPGEMIVDRTFHSETIERAHPRLARIRYEDRSAVRQPQALHITRFGLQVLGDTTLRHGLVGRPGTRLLRHADFATRLGALLAARRYDDADALGHLGLYLTQLETAATAR